MAKIKVGDLKKRIDKATSWRDVREIFYKFKNKWQAEFRTPFLSYLNNIDTYSLGSSEIQLISEFRQEVEDQIDTHHEEVVIGVPKRFVPTFEWADGISAPNLYDKHDCLFLYKTLKENEYNKEKASRALDLNTRAIRRKLKHFKDLGLIKGIE